MDAARCGETLLGVPQSVYQRCAFIPSGSLAIDADADLERRISALISTGDEKISFSQVESRLKKQLRQRKYNRSGSIPLLEAEIAGLRAAQQEAQTLTGQLENLQQQLSQARGGPGPPAVRPVSRSPRRLCAKKSAACRPSRQQ